MTRLIDSGALTKKLNLFNDRMHGNEHFLNGIESAKEIIENEPTIDAEPHWIPCSERLPEDGRYLCDYGDCIDFGRVINGEWYVNGVIAWMPLPEPYEGEGR